MPDPDGPNLILSIICPFLVCFLAYFFGDAFAQNEPDDSPRLGFSDGIMGGGFLLLIAFSFSVVFLMTVLPIKLLIIPILIVLGFVSCLCIALGRNSKKPSTAVNRFFSVIGLVMAFPAKGIFGMAKMAVADTVTEEDVLNFVDDVEEQDMIDENQKEMITNIFELDEVVARDIMTHRTEIISLEANTFAPEIIKISAERGFSRLPVYHKSVDTIIGILYIKDLLSSMNDANFETRTAKSFMRRVMFVPEACPAQDLLLEFRKKHTQIAVVIDEYGGTGGIVTMEDVLEEIVGNIQDEFDNEEEEIIMHADGFAEIAGSVDLEDVFAAFDLELELNEDEDEFDSVSGMMMDNLGHTPTKEENVSVEYHGLVFSVLQANDRRILKATCKVKTSSDDVDNKE